jgi:hypothetical protein
MVLEHDSCEGCGKWLPIQFFYFNMRRLGNGLCSDSDKSIPGIVLSGIVETLRSGVAVALQRIVETLGWTPKVQRLSKQTLSFSIV